MAQEKNKNKVLVEKIGSRLAHAISIEVDLSRVVAFSKPEEIDTHVEMYFENAVWSISRRSYDAIIDIWRAI